MVLSLKAEMIERKDYFSSEGIRMRKGWLSKRKKYIPGIIYLDHLSSEYPKKSIHTRVKTYSMELKEFPIQKGMTKNYTTLLDNFGERERDGKREGKFSWLE